jgi:AcrR family transcriptional regulator
LPAEVKPAAVERSGAGRVPGRPRDPATDRAILAATIRLLAEQGYDAMSVEGVATAAGVGKPAIYRRYPGKRELVVAALASLAAALEPPADSGDARADLLAFVRPPLDTLPRERIGFTMVGTLLVTERTEPSLIEMFRTAIYRPRLELGYEIVRRGIERGQIRAGVRPDVVIELIAGSVFTRHLIGEPQDDAWMEAVFDVVWRGITADAR